MEVREVGKSHKKWARGKKQQMNLRLDSHHLLGIKIRDKKAEMRR